VGTSNELRSATGDEGRACSQLSGVLDCLCHLVGLSHETDMQRCAGTSDMIQPTISRADNNSMYGSYIDLEV